MVTARLEFVDNGIDTAEPAEIDILPGEDFVEGYNQPTVLLAFNIAADEAGQVRAQINYLKGIFRQSENLIRKIGAAIICKGFGFDFLQLRRDDHF